MKKKIIISIIGLVLVLAAVGAVLWLQKDTDSTPITNVDANNFDKGSFDFENEETKVSGSFSEEDLNRIKNAFNDKELLDEAPGTSFNKNRALTLGDGQTYYLSDDGSCYVYWKNQKKYFQLSKAQFAIVERIIKEYGFDFSK